MFCGAFTTRMKPKLTTNCSSMVMPTTLMPGVATLLQHGDDDRDHRRCERRGAGKSEMNNDQEQAHHAEDEERGRVLAGRTASTTMLASHVARLGLQQRGAEADADAEQDDRFPTEFCGCASFQLMMPIPGRNISATAVIVVVLVSNLCSTLSVAQNPISAIEMQRAA